MGGIALRTVINVGEWLRRKQAGSVNVPSSRRVPSISLIVEDMLHSAPAFLYGSMLLSEVRKRLDSVRDMARRPFDLVFLLRIQFLRESIVKRTKHRCHTVRKVKPFVLYLGKHYF